MQTNCKCPALELQLAREVTGLRRDAVVFA
jgi:hypothetical protein